MYSRETEIRHISASDVYKLSLELEQSWKKLVRVIPKDLSNQTNSTNSTVYEPSKKEPFIAKYTSDHISMFERASRCENRLSTEILLKEWGTSGQVRPNIGHLLDLLVQAEIYRAADFVAEKFLNESPPKRPLTGPAAKVDVSIPFPTEEVKNIENFLDDISIPGTGTLNQNAQFGSEINNKDFYDKFQKERKQLDIEFSDLIQFSSSNIQPQTCDDNEFVSRSANIPNISEIFETRNNILTRSVNAGYISDVNTSPQHNKHKNNYQNGQAYEDMDDEYFFNDSADNIPILSALNNQDNSSIDENFPDLSILNASNNRKDSSGCSGVFEGNKSGGNTSNNSRSNSFGNSSSLSTNSDEGSNVTSNSSNLDPKSNDDSSLTNVTDTSENISFENDVTNPIAMNPKERTIENSTGLELPSDNLDDNISLLPNLSITDSTNNVPCLSELNITES